MTLSDAVLRELLDLTTFVKKGPFTRDALVKVVDRTDVFADGNIGVVVTSDREYTSLMLGKVQQAVRTSQLRGHQTEVMPW